MAIPDFSKIGQNLGNFAGSFMTDLGDPTVGFVKEQTNDFMGGWNEATKSVLPQAQRARKPELVFPRDMLVESQRPYIRFTCNKKIN